MGVTQLNNAEDFEKEVKNAAKGKLVIVDFFATWCGPCKMIAPKLEALSEKFSDVRFFKVDVDEVEDLASDQEISAMPTFLFFKDGEKVDTVMGANAEKIEEAIVKCK